MRADITKTFIWKALSKHHKDICDAHLIDYFIADPRRGARLKLVVGDLYIDYSKHLITLHTLDLLIRLAKKADLEKKRDAMFAGERINISENRAVLHTALRLPSEASLIVDGQNIVNNVHKVLKRMGGFTDKLHSGEWAGATGKRIKTVVNIGTGGSHLGPLMVCEALCHYADTGICARFVSNADPSDILTNLADLDSATTLFIIASKSFATTETLNNAIAARRWLINALGIDAVSKHFVAVSTNTKLVTEFGIKSENVFEFWNWVGGRYSVDSAIGLSIMAVIGRKRFSEFLAGFHLIDEHFRNAPLSENAPVLLALIGVWYSSFFRSQSRVIVPYSKNLYRFTSYLQQLTMESNGKSVQSDGTSVTINTGEIFWGEVGTNSQHTFCQLLHQGTQIIPADFIGFSKPLKDLPTADNKGSMHDLLMSNFFAQTQTLAFGKAFGPISKLIASSEVIPHKIMLGNRPTTSILATSLTPSVIGQLIALYEHQVFTKGVVWGINSFDQWGVELGKIQAKSLFSIVSSPTILSKQSDSSTDALIKQYKVEQKFTI